MLTTKAFGYEISWSLGVNCSSDESFGSNQEYHKTCLLPSGENTLSCKDSYDGWHGGKITIQGNTYCETFTSGREMTAQVIIAGNAIY